MAKVSVLFQHFVCLRAVNFWGYDQGGMCWGNLVGGRENRWLNVGQLRRPLQ